jgi:ionotropic glutamate receptor
MSFDNRTRLIVTIFDEPFMMLKKNRNDTLTEKSIPRGTILDPSLVEGFCVDLAEAICHDNLKLPYKFFIETKYGNEVAKGVWDGMVGALVNHEADICIASLTINGAREKAVDFSKPFIDLGISIMIGKPEKQKPGVFSFMAPLSKEIWICVIISYLLVNVILFFVSRSSSYEWYFENETDLIPKNKFSMENALFFSFAAFMHQGVDLLPRSFSGLSNINSSHICSRLEYLFLGRVVTSAWWFFSLILVSSYTANLAAFLTVEKLVPPIETVEDLSNQTGIRYGTLSGGSTMAFFNKSTLTTFKRMWNFMQQHKDDVFVKSNRDGIDKVRQSKGKFAFLLESTLNEYVNERFPCDTMRIGENIDAKGYGIATPLGSDLREATNIAVLKLTENGFLERLKRKWYYERSECTNVGTKDSKQSTPLNLANVAGMFYVLIIGLGAAMVIAFIEFLFKAKTDSARLNQNIRDVMRRNLRISITGIDFDEKQSADYWPLQQQQQHQQATSSNYRGNERNDRTPTITSVFDLPGTGESTGFDKQKDVIYRGSNRDHISHV